MDIAKYITTAVILTSVIGGFEDKTTLYVFAFLVVAVTLGWGLYLVKDNTKKGK